MSVNNTSSRVAGERTGLKPIEEIRRAELVGAAIRTISEVGFDRTTVRKVAEAAGGSVGIVHYYFKTKDDLLKAAFEEVEGRFRAAIAEHLGDTGTSAVDRLRRVVDLSFPTPGDPLDEWPLVVELWRQAGEHRDMRELYTVANEQWLDDLKGIITQGIDRGEITPLDARAMALVLSAAIDGLGLYSRVTDHVSSDAARCAAHRLVDLLTLR